MQKNDTNSIIIVQDTGTMYFIMIRDKYFSLHKHRSLQLLQKIILHPALGIHISLSVYSFLHDTFWNFSVSMLQRCSIHMKYYICNVYAQI